MTVRAFAAVMTLPLAACCTRPDLRANWYFVPESEKTVLSQPAESKSSYEGLTTSSRLKLAILNHDKQPVVLQSVLINPTSEKSATTDVARTWKPDSTVQLAPGEMWVLDLSPKSEATKGTDSLSTKVRSPRWLSHCQIPVFVRVVACRAEGDVTPTCVTEPSASLLRIPGAMPTTLPDGWEECRGTHMPAFR